jgi:3-oxoacyl-[acyl-carrier-protein] synthase II
MKRVAVFGWGLVAPGAANISEFEQMLAGAETHLDSFDGFGRGPFLVGQPKFDFADYEPWLASRFPPSRARQLREKMDDTSLYAIGAFIQALGQNAPLESLLHELDQKAHVYVGNALGALPTIYRSSVELYRAQRRWNRFWANPERNESLRAHLAGSTPPVDLPADPSAASEPDEREAAEDAWFAFWAPRSEALQHYIEELSQIEAQVIEGEVESGKMKVLRDKSRKLAQLHEKWQAPPPPWASVSANLLWNIPNTPASQISMLGRITGPAFAPVAACSTFGVALRLGMEAIREGNARLAVIGSADPPPHPLTVGAFYSARVLSAGRALSKPLSQLRGTHVAGGSCVWILGDLEWGRGRGLVPLGIEPLAVGMSSDADHIITPSEEGPLASMRDALARAEVAAEDLVSWDLHATATPGDFQELSNLQKVLTKSTVVSARKGTFGHGMGAGGGWELTAQYLGVRRGRLFPTSLRASDVHETIRDLGQQLVMDQPTAIGPGPVGKLSMGVGGVNACVISRPFTDEDAESPPGG